MNIKIIPDCVKSRLKYNKRDGLFVWNYKNKHHPRLYKQKAGSIVHGYVVIKINGSPFKAHRLAWFIVYNEQPEMIDHINGNKLDNRISNLRACTSFQNTQNHLKRKGKSGLPVGVRNTTSGKYQARITANNKVHSLGVFVHIDDAIKAYSDARKDLHDAPCTRN